MCRVYSAPWTGQVFPGTSVTPGTKTCSGLRSRMVRAAPSSQNGHESVSTTTIWRPAAQRLAAASSPTTAVRSMNFHDTNGSLRSQMSADVFAECQPDIYRTDSGRVAQAQFGVARPLPDQVCEMI